MAYSPVSPTPEQLVDVYHLHATVGAAFIGMIVSAVLFGVSNLQLYIYYQQFPSDWIVYRLSVGIIWFLDALNLIMTIHGVYHYLVSGFGDYAALMPVVWSFKVQTLTNVFVVVAVQALYSVRLWRLNYRKTLLPRLVPFTVVIGAGIGTALTIETFKLESFMQISQLAWLNYASFGTVAFIDFAIAGTMCYYLNGSRSDFQATNSMISTLVMWTLNTGILTSLCSLVSLIAFAVMPNNLIFLAIDFLLSKLYYNSFLAMLNARKAIQVRGSEEYSVNVSHGRAPIVSSPRGMPGLSHPEEASIPLEIKVHRTTDNHIDDFYSVHFDSYPRFPLKGKERVDNVVL